MKQKEIGDSMEHRAMVQLTYCGNNRYTATIKLFVDKGDGSIAMRKRVIQGTTDRV